MTTQSLTDISGLSVEYYFSASDYNRFTPFERSTYGRITYKYTSVIDYAPIIHPPTNVISNSYLDRNLCVIGGWFLPSVSGNHTFMVTLSDTAKIYKSIYIYINRAVITTPNNDSSSVSASVDLDAGVYYMFDLFIQHYYDNGLSSFDQTPGLSVTPSGGQWFAKNYSVS